jgi:hypothetical protein
MVCAARGSTVIKFALVGSHGEPVYATCCSCCDPSNGLKSSSKFKTHTRIYIYIYVSELYRFKSFRFVSGRIRVWSLRFVSRPSPIVSNNSVSFRFHCMSDCF